MVARRSMAEHRGGCAREEVGCPCPWCEVRRARAEVGGQVEEEGAVHARLAWRRAVEMEEKVVELQTKVVQQGSVIAGLQKHGRVEEKVADPQKLNPKSTPQPELDLLKQTPKPELSTFNPQLQTFKPQVTEQGSILLEQKGEIALLASQGNSLGGDLHGLRVDVGKQGEENTVLRTKVPRPRIRT